MIGKEKEAKLMHFMKPLLIEAKPEHNMTRKGHLTLSKDFDISSFTAIDPYILESLHIAWSI